MARLTENDVQNAVVEDPIATMRQAFVEGKDAEAAVYGGTGAPDNPAIIETETEIVESAPTETPILEELDTEVLWAKDETGKRQKIEVDYKNRESIKKAYLKAVGMRKFQAERDNEKKQRAELEKKLTELSGNFSELERAYKDGGAKGIFERLGGEGAWEKAVADELSRREKLAAMSPDERIALEKDQLLKRAEVEKAAILANHQKMMAELTAERETAAERSLYSRLTPAFEKYRFHGKLGDDAAEHAIDKAIWSEVTAKLAEYPDDVELTRSVLDKEFRQASAIYQKVISKQVESQTATLLQNKKADAATRTQTLVKKNLTAQSMDQELANDLKNSDWSSVLQKVFNKRK